jgi:hypothetical protein
MPPFANPVNRFSKWLGYEANRNTLMRNAFYFCQNSLQTGINGNPIPYYSDDNGMVWDGGGSLYYNNQTYDDLDWRNKVKAYNNLDPFFKAAMFNYHNIYNA